MAADHLWKAARAVRDALDTLVWPMQRIVDFPAWGMHALSDSLKTRDTLREENTALRTERLQLRAELQKLTALQLENMRLRGLLESSAHLGDRVFIAELLAVDLDPSRHRVLIDKGGKHGVYEGQPALDAQGVVGQVVQVSPVNAQVMLLTDPDHALPVQITRTGLRTVAVGTGEREHLELPYLPANADVVPGDLLVTSGLGGFFPAGYPVGTVTDVQRPAEAGFARVYAQPAAGLERGRELLLVRRPPPPPPEFAGPELQ